MNIKLYCSQNFINVIVDYINNCSKRYTIVTEDICNITFYSNRIKIIFNTNSVGKRYCITFKELYYYAQKSHS